MNVFRHTPTFQAQMQPGPQQHQYQAPPMRLSHPQPFVYSSALPHIGTLNASCNASYSMPFHGDPKILAFCPGEVRHRRRTSRQQLAVLEDVFVNDQKPGPALRKKLALQLDMTPRTVQVWFQNRRAKEKNLDKKRKALIDHQGGTVSDDAQGDDADDDDLDIDIEADDVPSQSYSRPSTASSANTAPAASESHAPSHVAPSPPSSEGSAPDLALLRRGSAPAVITTAEPIRPPAVMPLGPPDAARRASLENFHRISPPSAFRSQLVARPSRLQHSITAPVSATATTSTFTTNINRWAEKAASSTYAPRAPAPVSLPGPLPEAGFSFGAPPSTDNQQQQQVEYPDSYSRHGSFSLVDYSRHGSFADAYPPSGLLAQPRWGSTVSSDEDLQPPMSRFASFASSNASNSTYYSTLATPDSGWSRRSSMAPEFANMMGNLQVSQAAASYPYQDTAAAAVPAPMYYEQGQSQASTSQLQQQQQQQQQQYDSSPSAYHDSNSSYQGSPSGDWSSPSSSDTIAADSHQQQQVQAATAPPVKHVSELEFALGMPSTETPAQLGNVMEQPQQQPQQQQIYSQAIEPGSLASAMGVGELSSHSHSSPNGLLCTPVTVQPHQHQRQHQHQPVQVVVAEQSYGYVQQQQPQQYQVASACEQQQYVQPGMVYQPELLQQNMQAVGLGLMDAYPYYAHAQ
ncbi:hypothetical protein BKA62DRAFT_764635 [Auriculariales sp. MPI-PUGE-AT-0066]|nr:hypothetical protein BKA62DRAFT_764635 [Auriculariales sp. MPI-PUGE-AT-0066]